MAGGVVKDRTPVEPVMAMLKETSVWLACSLAGPTLRLVAKLATDCGPASSSTVGGLPPSVKVGASLTGLTVMVQVWGALVLTLGGAPEPLPARRSSDLAVPLASAAA